MTNPADSRTPDAPSGETAPCPDCCDGMLSLPHGDRVPCSGCAGTGRVPSVSSSAPSGETLQSRVYAWLGFCRDRMPPDLVASLQDALGPLHSVPSVPSGANPAPSDEGKAEGHADWHLLDRQPPAWVATAVTDARNRAKWSPPDGRSHAHEALRWFHYSREALVAEIARLTRERDEAQDDAKAGWQMVVKNRTITENAVRAEREACAQLVESAHKRWAQLRETTCDLIAEEIRARASSPPGATCPVADANTDGAFSCTRPAGHDGPCAAVPRGEHA